jgi:hypothetical protein
VDDYSMLSFNQWFGDAAWVHLICKQELLEQLKPNQTKEEGT